MACGTGIVTRRLREALGAGARLTATDLSDAMIAYARAQVAAAPGLEFRTADAAALPFETASFDAVVCQFGIMFVPDNSRAAACREAGRVLAPGGTFLFNVWDSLRFHPVSRIAHETIASLFPDNPPEFHEIPFGFSDAQAIRGLLDDAGFADQSIHVVSLASRSPSARDYAAGLVTGTPMATAIQERGTVPIERVLDAVTEAIAKDFGAGPIDAPMRALVVEARVPA